MMVLLLTSRKYIIAVGLAVLMLAAGQFFFNAAHGAPCPDCCLAENVCGDECCDGEDKPYCDEDKEECVECLVNSAPEESPFDHNCVECEDGKWVEDPPCDSDLKLCQIFVAAKAALCVDGAENFLEFMACNIESLIDSKKCKDAWDECVEGCD